MSESFDVAIIGAGSAGMAAHAAASRHGVRALLLEGGEFGTTCARNGCMPSKLLLAAADIARHLDQAAEFGISAGGVTIDGRAVMERVRRLRDDFVGSVLRVIERIPVEQRLHGMARFVAPGELQVENRRIVARAIVIASGSTPFIPEQLRQLGGRLLTSDSVFELDCLPSSLAVVGGGVIGLEIGQAMHRLGVRVRLFERGSTLGPAGDGAISALSTRVFAASMPCEFNAEPIARLVEEGDVELQWVAADGSDKRERFDHVLAATGRRPTLSPLALENAALLLDARGIPLFDPATMRCGDSNVFVAGDVDGQRPLLHEAAGEGRIAGDNAARFPDVRAHRRRVRLEIAFTDPQFATVGLLPGEPGAESASIGEVDFSRQGRSRVIGRACGMLRVYGNRDSGRLVGAQMLGPAAEHLAHLLAWAIEQQISVEDALAMPYYHPVIEEGVRTALRDLRHAMDRGEPPRPDCLDCGPGT